MTRHTWNFEKAIRLILLFTDPVTFINHILCDHKIWDAITQRFQYHATYYWFQFKHVHCLFGWLSGVVFSYMHDHVGSILHGFHHLCSPTIICIWFHYSTQWIHFLRNGCKSVQWMEIFKILYIQFWRSFRNYGPGSLSIIVVCVENNWLINSVL